MQYPQSLISAALPVTIANEVFDCRDAKNNLLLALALNAEADFLVTGDADLLVLDPWRGVLVVTPAAFLHTVD